MLSPTPPIDRPNVHPGTGYVIGPRVPHGLAAIVEGLTREVIRHRPEDIYVFAAEHFENLLKLREQYHTEVYSGSEFNHGFNREFNLCPTKVSRGIGRSPTSAWSPDDTTEILERNKEVPGNSEKRRESISVDDENRKASTQTYSNGSLTTKNTSKKPLKRLENNEITSNCTTGKIPEMSALREHSRNIQTKDIKQEFRKNKLNGEKGKVIRGVEKEIRNERRPRTRVSKSDKSPKEESECTTTSDRSIRRPLKKVRRIETESETETEHETAVKSAVRNGYERSIAKGDIESCEANLRNESRERKEDWLSEHSSKRKVSSRALSMDRIRAYVLRKFASTASLEVLRSPTYIEEVQEVIDRAAPVIKEKLEEMRRPLGKRSRSVDLAWNMNERSIDQHIRDTRKRSEDSDREGKERRRKQRVERKKSAGERYQESDIAMKEDIVRSSETEEDVRKSRERVYSGKRSRRRVNDDFRAADQIDGESNSNSSEHESNVMHDTLETRLSATQSILEGISMSTSQLAGIRKNDLLVDEHETSDPMISDRVNGVCLPIVRPPSSKNSRSATKNGSDSLTLPPISPEAPRSTKKKDELSLPILPAAGGNSSAGRTDQDGSKDAEEASTMHDITSDMEDIAIPGDEHENIIVSAKQDPTNEELGSGRSRRESDGNKKEDLGRDLEATDEISQENVSGKSIDKGGSETSPNQVVEENVENKQLQEERIEEIFKDSLNVTPEPHRSDSLVSDEDQVEELENNNRDFARDTFDGLKDKLIEIETAERSIEKALVGQQTTSYDTAGTSEVEKSMTDGNINELGKSASEVEKIMSEVEKSASQAEKSTVEGKIPTNVVKEWTNGAKIEKMENKIEKSVNGMEQLTNETGKNEIEKTANKAGISTGIDEVSTKIEVENSINTIGNSINEAERLLNGIEKPAVKLHVESLQNLNSKLRYTNDSIVKVLTDETGKENVTPSDNKTETSTNEFSTIATPGKYTIENEDSGKLPIENRVGSLGSRKKGEIDKLSETLLSLEIPFSYVLSEGSPCEIPDSVTTVIIPDRSCQSPVIDIPKINHQQLELTNSSIEREQLIIGRDLDEESSNDATKIEEQGGCSMEVFGEYIRPEIDVLPVDIDFVRGVKSNQDMVVVHQDLDRIKEEEEEEEREDNGRGKGNNQKEKDNEKAVDDEGTVKIATLEDIMEHEEDEETEGRIIPRPDDTSFRVPEFESSPEAAQLMDSDLTEDGTCDIAVESRSTVGNSSQGSGGTQDTQTTTPSDMRENVTSNRSTESSNADRPVVPELNLDSLQDNTISSFKMTANGTTMKESNGSLHESDATISLTEPLTSDEIIGNRATLPGHEEEVPIEESTDSLPRVLQSEVPEADRSLYETECIEHKCLEKAPLSSDTNLEDGANLQENITDLKVLPNKLIDVASLAREKKKQEKVSSEEEIARELIGSLDEGIQHSIEKSDIEKENNNNIGDSERDLSTGEKSSAQLEPIQLISIDNLEKKESKAPSKIEVSSDKENSSVEQTSELSEQTINISHNSDGKNDLTLNRETDVSISKVKAKEHIETLQIISLTENAFLEQNAGHEIVREDITIEDNLGINKDVADQKESEDKQQNNDEIVKYQNSESISKEQLIGKRKDNEQDLTIQEECRQEKSKDQKELQIEKRRKQEVLEDQKECEGNGLKNQKRNEEDLKTQEEVIETATISSEKIERRKNSMEESTKSDNNDKYDETNTVNLISRDESVINKQTEDNVKDEKKEKVKYSSAEEEHTDKIVSDAISNESTNDHSHSRYWTMGTKSSTVETVIAAFNPNASIEKGMEISTDKSEIIKNESITQKQDDFYSAAIKIQACIRGFLARHHMRKDRCSEFVSDNILSAQQTIVNGHLAVPQDHPRLQESRRGRQRLRREEAFRKTTLSLENAFATSRLQHTGEFHDCVPLPLYDATKGENNSIPRNGSSDGKRENNTEHDKSGIAKSTTNVGDYVHSAYNEERRGSFQEDVAFADHSAFPIMMHLLADASRNCHFRVQSQNIDRPYNLNSNVETNVETKSMEPTMDILMLGYPRDDMNLQDGYLNFITSIEDVGSNLDCLSMNTTKNPSTSNDIQSSMTSKGSIREPLALPGTPQGVIIEEVTSLDEIGIVASMRSESTKSSTAPKTSLDTNSSMHCEDDKDDLEKSSRTSLSGEDNGKSEARG